MSDGTAVDVNESDEDRAARGAAFQRFWWPAALLVAIGVLIAHTQRYADYSVDDAFISYRYGANWAAGHGLVFNPGERVEGYSNLAWTLLFGGVSAFAEDPVATIKGLGVALGAAAMVLLALLARDATRSRGFALLIVFAVASNRFVACWIVAGLESPLFLLELVAMALFAARDRPIPYGVAAALCCLTRPEGVALVGAVAAERAWDARRIRWAYALPLLAFAAQMAFRLIYYGDYVPNTARVKLGGGLPQLVQGVEYVFDLFGDWSVWVGLPALVAAPLLLWRRASVRISALLAGGYFAFLVYSGGDFFPLYRLPAPLIPLMTVAAVAAGLEASRRFGPTPERARQARAVWAVVVVLAFVVAPLLGNEKGQARVERETKMLYRFSRPAAYWLRDHSPPGSTLALTVAGAIPYYSELRIIDRFGLSDVEIARAEVPWEDHRSGISKYDPDSVLRRRPDWILLDANETKLRRGPISTLHPADRALLSRPRFEQEYRAVPDWIGDANSRLALFVRKGSDAERALDGLALPRN